MFIIPNTRRIIKVTLVKLQNISYCSEKKFLEMIWNLQFIARTFLLILWLLHRPQTTNLRVYAPFCCEDDARFLGFFFFFFVYLFITRGPRWQNNRTVELERTTQDGEHGWCGSFLLKKTRYRITVQMGPGPLGLKTTTHTLWLHSLFPFGDLMMMPPSGHLHISRLMMHLFTYLPMYLGKLS